MPTWGAARPIPGSLVHGRGHVFENGLQGAIDIFYGNGLLFQELVRICEYV
jgi:hypothetical protein